MFDVSLMLRIRIFTRYRIFALNHIIILCFS